MAGLAGPDHRHRTLVQIYGDFGVRAVFLERRLDLVVRGAEVPFEDRHRLIGVQQSNSDHDLVRFWAEIKFDVHAMNAGGGGREEGRGWIILSRTAMSMLIEERLCVLCRSSDWGFRGNSAREL